MNEMKCLALKRLSKTLKRLSKTLIIDMMNNILYFYVLMIDVVVSCICSEIWLGVHLPLKKIMLLCYFIYNWRYH